MLGAAALAACTGVANSPTDGPAPTPEPPTPPPAPTPDPALAAALARGVAWLWAQQDPETGRFGSKRYGFMSAGQSLTPFVMLALSRVPVAIAPPPEGGLRKGFTAILGMAGLDGAIGFGAAAPDYPVYSTSLATQVVMQLRPDHWRQIAGPMVAWLRTQQMLAADGWNGHPAQGGFGFGSMKARIPPDAGHVDLSMTRRALQALVAFGADSATDPALLQGAAFVTRCQSPDGGFVYSPVELALNKGARDPARTTELDAYAGYGSATCDGVLALTALGGHEAQIQQGLAWLHAHHRLDQNPGVGDGPVVQFAAAMRGYYRAGAAQVFALHGGPSGWRGAMADAVLAEQLADGRWQNEVALQKEDEPLVATTFAVQALTAALSN